MRWPGWVGSMVLCMAVVQPFAAPPATARRTQSDARDWARRMPAGTRVWRDLEYGRVQDRALRLDLYVPQRSPAPRPLIIWVHGGAWRAGSKNGRSPALQLLAEGYAVAQVEYRLSQEARWPAQIHDCKAAVRWLRAQAAEYGLDPDRFAAWGSSAGGHLVALLGTSASVEPLEGTVNTVTASSRVQAVVDWFGPTDFLQMNRAGSRMDHEAPGSPESQLLGRPIRECPDLVAQANPITYVSPDDPPFLIMHGTEDPLVPFNQSELLAAALKKAGVPVEFVPVEGAGHGFRGPEHIARVRVFLNKFLGRTQRSQAVRPSAEPAGASGAEH